jgi:phytoene synthase
VTLEETREEVRARLRQAADEVTLLGLARPALDGKLLRPLTAYLTVPPDRRGDLDRRFWMGALAVEMVHEASLYHDDILDEAPERRGKATLVASRGVGAALVLGDHLLTSAYRVAARTASPVFLDLFIRSVERTVSGELDQQRRQGRILEGGEYRRVIEAKSGELFRSAFALAPALLGIADPERVAEVGARLGRLYQMVDDFLDYCPGADRGKLPLQDYRQKKWTWPLGLIGARDFEATEEEILSRLFRSSGRFEPTPMDQGVEEMRRQIRGLVDDLEEEGMESVRLGMILEGWIRQMREAVEREALHLRSALVEEGRALGGPEAWIGYFGRHSASFRFASRLFPSGELQRVAGLYTLCRFTDDLVDDAGGRDPSHVEARLDTWRELMHEAYGGRETGVPLLDAVMGEAAGQGIPLRYADELVEGVRMDLRPREYESLKELRTYSHRVASVVGGWMTELFGVRDPRVLERAHALGHAMQLTNILRDVGEDLRRGRLYLPRDHMARHGVDRDLLHAMAARPGGQVFPGYRFLLDDLMAAADTDYERAFEAIPHLPTFARGPVAVAARVYQGIHDEIRRNGYDNLSRRARTSLPRKLALATGALIDLRRLPDPAPDGSSLAPVGSPGPVAVLSPRTRT